eukprot:Phypoly_transcript_11662.p1 GENE.Phypoly_transcript_11662~~Phypoly_transcript_11662.p1  ORF type:complete len:394 (+),score=35.19 Phypoly_transcript_11662:32-1183(+)
MEHEYTRRETDHESKLGNSVGEEHKGLSILFANLVVAVLVILQTATVTLTKRLACTMEDYPFTLTQLQPFSTTITFSALYFIVNSVEKRRHTYGYASIHEESHSFPKWKLAIIGGLFTLSNFCLFSGGRGKYLSGPLLTLFQQVSVPCTIFLSIVMLRRKFSILHYLGALVILGGIIFVIWPKLIDKQEEKDSEWWAAALVMASTLFQAAAIVYMEKNLKYYQMPFLSSWAWINVFEFILTFPLVIAIPPVQGVRFHDIPHNILNGYECFFTNKNHLTHTSCDYVGAWFVLFIAVLVCNKLLMTYVIKEGSSALAMISLTCAFPLSNLAFSSKDIVGECSAAAIYWREFVGLGIVVVGLLLYRYTMFVPLFTKKKELLNVNNE